MRFCNSFSNKCTWGNSQDASDCQVMFVLSAYSYSALTYERPHNNVYHYPGWAIAIGWILACLSVTMIPVVMTVKLLYTGGPLLHVSSARFSFGQLLTHEELHTVITCTRQELCEYRDTTTTNAWFTILVTPGFFSVLPEFGDSRSSGSSGFSG